MAFETLDPSLALPAGPGAAIASDARYQALDDAELQAQFSRPAEQEGLTESWLLVDGMVCAACAQSIEQRLGGMPGVHRVQVNAAAGRAKLIWDQRQTAVSTLFAAIAQLNYRPYPVQHIEGDLQRRRQQRQALWRLFVAGFCMMQVMMYATPIYFATPGDITPDMEQLLKWASWLLSLPIVLFAAGPFFRSAWQDLLARRIGMDVPVSLGILITFVASSLALMQRSGEVYFDSLSMFVFFLLGGRYLETLARNKVAGNLEQLAKRLPSSVERLLDYPASGESRPALAHQLRSGDVLRILPGQAFPGDGVVLDGHSAVDEALLTGEGQPVDKSPGDPLVAGSYNLHAPLLMRLERLGRDSRFGEIVALMERAASEKPRLAALADRYAAHFLLAVLVLAALAAGVWRLIEPARAIWVAVAVLVVTCPCALSLATPAAILAASGRLAREGVLVAHPAALEAMAEAQRVVFDKTGTLSHEQVLLKSVQVVREGFDAQRALALAAALDAQSLHPIARALQRAVATEAAPLKLESLHEERGQGVEAWFEGERYRLGRASFAWPDFRIEDSIDVSSLLADQNGPIAVLHFGERLREDAVAALQALRVQGLQLAMLSGDRSHSAAAIAAQAGISEVLSEQTPESKLAALAAWQQGGAGRDAQRVIMVGDGINDGPVLSRADVSVVMGSGAPLSQSDADLVLLSNRLGDLPLAIALARRTQAIIKQNLCWAAAYNALCVPLAMLGWLPPWLAGLGMAASSLLVVLNALRLAR
ncbi:cation-translocating P-type ATPase [Uliginosibacterium sediminicola]|uniref:Cation-translocating P-type ATPase n=1 Tax=Uliginosibacterium sediminicola TaxID=2024550 RepID=A0ABU9Z0M6_9RHOO